MWFRLIIGLPLLKMNVVHDVKNRQQQRNMWCKTRLKGKSLLSLHILKLIFRHVVIYVNIYI